MQQQWTMTMMTDVGETMVANAPTVGPCCCHQLSQLQVALAAFIKSSTTGLSQWSPHDNDMNNNDDVIEKMMTLLWVE